MGCINSKPASSKPASQGRGIEKEPPDADDPFPFPEELVTRPDVHSVSTNRDSSVTQSQLDVSTRGLNSGFRHTSGLRVGVIESKRTSVTLLNDYIVLGALGKGAYGSVKLCYSMQDDNLYALKVLHRTQLKRQMLGPRRAPSGGGDALEMLRREVDVMRSMNHPNLIKIYEVIEAEDKVVMVQEYAEAGPLQHSEAPMGESLAQYYFRQMVDGLAYLHGAAVVHGDLKPDNVLLSGGGLVKIADFGQAHFFNEGADVFDKTLGTPAFMAPEVRSGGAYRGKPADMWALGVTLYCFLFANLPFKGATLDELYEAVRTQDVQYPEHIPISVELRSVLEGLLSKDPARRPTAEQLRHHPWVALPEEGRDSRETESMELARMDDAPSLEKWTNELVSQEQQGPSPMATAVEVAAGVFGRGILEGAQSITTQALMDVIQDSNADGVAMPLVASLRPDAIWEVQQGMREGTILEGDEEGEDTDEEGEADEEAEEEAEEGGGPSELQITSPAIQRSGSSALAAAWQQSAAASAAESAASASPGSRGGSLDANGAGTTPARRLSSRRRSPRAGVSKQLSSRASPEEVAAELDSLLGTLDGEAQRLPAVAEGDPEQGNGHANGGAAPPPPLPAEGYRRVGFPAPQHSPEHDTGVTPFAAAAGTPLGGFGQSRHGSLSQPRSSVRSSAGHGSLPMSPFESAPPGSLPPVDSSLSPSQHSLSLHPPRVERERASSLAALARTSLAPPPEAHFPVGTRLESTGEVWDALRSKALSNKTPGVRFVSFPADADLDIPEKAVGAYCLLIESGIVDVRYVAVLDYQKISQRVARRRRSAAARYSSGSGSSSGSDSDEEGRLNRRDSVARGPDARAVVPRKGQRSMEHSTSLQLTVDQVLERAQRVLASANSNSEANMLCTVRGPNDFLGISALLEPAAHRKLRERWRPVFRARTEVRGVALSRQAVELLLKQYPLSQVYLRSTLSKGRAEILQLESLENIASCLAPAAPSRNTTRERMKGSSAERLDIFRAVSFARQLAAQLADQVTQGEHGAEADGASAANPSLPKFLKPDFGRGAKQGRGAIIPRLGGRGKPRPARGGGSSGRSEP